MKPERIHPYGVRSGSRGLVSPVVVQLYLHHLLKGCPSSLEIIGHSCGTSVTPHLSLFLGLVFPYLSDHQVCFHPLHPLPRTPYPLPGSGEEPPPRAAPTAPWSSDSEAERNVCSVGCPFLHLVAGGLPSQGHPRGPFFAARLLDKLSQSFPINTHLSLRQHHSQTGLGGTRGARYDVLGSSQLLASPLQTQRPRSTMSVSQLLPLKFKEFSRGSGLWMEGSQPEFTGWVYGWV